MSEFACHLYIDKHVFVMKYRCAEMKHILLILAFKYKIQYAIKPLENSKVFIYWWVFWHFRCSHKSITLDDATKFQSNAYYHMYMHIDCVYVLMMFLFCLILKNGQCCNLLQAELEELIILTVLDLMLLCIVVLIDKDSLHSHLDTFYSKQLFLSWRT